MICLATSIVSNCIVAECTIQCLKGLGSDWSGSWISPTSGSAGSGSRVWVCRRPGLRSTSFRLDRLYIKYVCGRGSKGHFQSVLLDRSGSDCVGPVSNLGHLPTVGPARSPD